MVARMRSFAISAVLAILVPTAAAHAFPSRPPVVLADKPDSIDRLFPEIMAEGDGWRGLLPVMLLNAQEAARRPAIRPDRRQTATR